MKIPVTIVTGFLGAGKTTLINNLLRQLKDQRLAVLVNEFGEVSVDGALLADACREGGMPLFELSKGCICCTVAESFVPRMREIAANKGRIDHVLVETSGLALPVPVMMALNWMELRNDFYLDALITVVDTPLLLEHATERDAVGNALGGGAGAAGVPAGHPAAVMDIFRQQIENADVVALNKIEGLGDDALGKAEELVREKCPGLRFLELAWDGQLDPRLSLGLNLHGGRDEGHHHHHHGHHPSGLHYAPHHGPVHSAPGAGDAPPADQSSFDGHAHGAQDPHTHGDGSHQHFHAHDPGWQSFTLHAHREQDAEKIKAAVQTLCREEPILRAKGSVRVPGKEYPLVIQAVRTRLHAYYGTAAEGRHESTLVFIGYHPSRERAAAILTEATGCSWH